MRPWKHLFILHIVFLFCISQGSYLKADSITAIDSLKLNLEQAKGAEKLEIYIDLIGQLRNINPRQGVTFARQAIVLADSLGANLAKARVYNEEGVCYRKMNFLEKALQLHLDALRIFEKGRDSLGIAFSYANIGHVYFQFGEHEKALDFHFRSLYLKEFLNDELQIAYSQNAIGLVLTNMGEYIRALDFFVSALAIYKRHDKPLQLSNVYASMGRVMTKMKHYGQALEFVKSAYNIYKAINNERGVALALNQIAELLYTRGSYDAALDTLKRAEQISLRQHDPGILRFNYRLQTRIYESKKDYKQAFQMSGLVLQYSDSLFNESKNRELMEIMVHYETTQLDNENEILKLQIRQQNMRERYIILAALIILLLLIIGFLIWLFFRKKKHTNTLTKLNQNLEKRVEERTKELKERGDELQQAFNALKQSEEKLRAISETVPFGIIVTDKEGKINYFNKMLPETSGLNKNVLMQGEWFRHILHEDRKQIETLWKKAHKEEKSLDDTSFRIRHINQILWMRIKGSPLFDHTGFIGSVILMENITKNKKFEQDLIAAKNKAEESDKVKSTFLANMSHEIRTPMNVILGFADLLATDEYSSEEKVEFVDMIQSSGKLLLNRINDIIDISKIEAGELKIHPSAFKLQSLLDEIAITFRQQLDQAGKPQVRLLLSNNELPSDEMIFTDKLRLQQIFTNLLSNAVKFTHDGHIEFGVIRGKDEYQFFVKDTGIGIPESKLGVIFENFRQADDSHTRIYGGTGLGLAITRNLTKLLGGTVWVESVVNKGTVFYFTLPADSTPKPRTILDYPDYSDKHILVAEDIETNYELLETMLIHSGVKTIHAANGLIALDMVTEAHPDMILMDIQMPVMDGKESLKRLREQGYQRPVIAITAFASTEADDQYAKLGFDSYLSKPLSIEKLYQVLDLFFKEET